MSAHILQEMFTQRVNKQQKQVTQSPKQCNIFPWQFPRLLVNSLTFTWPLINSLTFPGSPDKWTTWIKPIPLSC